MDKKQPQRHKATKFLIADYTDFFDLIVHRKHKTREEKIMVFWIFKGIICRDKNIRRAQMTMTEINNPIFLAGIVLAALAVFALLVKVIITLTRGIFWKPKIPESRRGRHVC